MHRAVFERDVSRIPDHCAVAEMLREYGQAGRDRLGGRLVPMVGVRMGDDHRIDIDDLLQRPWQPYRRVAQMRVGGAGKARPRLLGRQHRVDQEAGTAIFNDERRIANLGDFHASILGEGWHVCEHARLPVQAVTICLPHEN